MANSDAYLFHEVIQEPKTDEFQDGRCEVYANLDGYFITVETDSFEGCAQMTLPVAVKAHKALGKAIALAQAARGYQIIAASPLEVGLVRNGIGIRTWWVSEFDSVFPSLEHPIIQEAIRINESRRDNTV